jgi:hypothetical protein
LNLLHPRPSKSNRPPLLSSLDVRSRWCLPTRRLRHPSSRRPNSPPLHNLREILFMRLRPYPKLGLMQLMLSFKSNKNTFNLRPSR